MSARNENRFAAVCISANHIRANEVNANHISAINLSVIQAVVLSLSAITADLGTVSAGLLNSGGGSPTAGIRLTSAYAKPGSWVNYIDFGATSTAVMANLGDVEILADGTTTVGGTITAESFTGSQAVFDGEIMLETGYFKMNVDGTTANDIWINTATAGTPVLQFRLSNGDLFYDMSESGDATAYNGSWIDSSDRVLKDDLRPLSGVLDKLLTLTPYSYRASEYARARGRKSCRREIGFVAQDVRAVFPEVVRELTAAPNVAKMSPAEAEAATDAAGPPLLGIAYGRLVPILVEAIRELTEEVRALKAAA